MYAKRLPNDRAYFLETLSAGIVATKLPEQEQRKAIASIFRVPEDKRLILSRLFMPDLTKIHDADLRIRAQLRCAGTALAVERFRQVHGRWPNELAEIPKDILAAVPLDPFDGKALKYVRRADGVTVYSIGPDETDDGGTILDGGPNKLPGQDIGFRLYDVNQRGLPPLPRDEPVGERDEP